MFVCISAQKQDPDLLLFNLGEKLIGVLQVSDATDLQYTLLKQLLRGTDAKAIKFPDIIMVEVMASQIKDICEIFDVGVRVG